MGRLACWSNTAVVQGREAVSTQNTAVKIGAETQAISTTARLLDPASHLGQTRKQAQAGSGDMFKVTK